MELPVVTSSLAEEGLRVDGEDSPPVRVAESNEEFADQIVKLLASERERLALGAQGRCFVEKNFNWSRSAEKLESMCVEAAREMQR